MLCITNQAYHRVIFPVVMSKYRFKFLTLFMRVDIYEIQIRTEQGCFAPIRVVFDKFVETYKAAYNPGNHLTVDDCLEVSPHSAFLCSI